MIIKRKLLNDVYTGKMIICSVDEYHAYVKAAIIKECSKHEYLGNNEALRILKTELHRLDLLHTRELSVA